MESHCCVVGSLWMHALYKLPEWSRDGVGAGQVIWASIYGLFFGYLVVRTGSLLPAMIVHYFGNAFMGSLTSYVQALASPEIQAVYGVIFWFGLIPTTLLILWVQFFATKWPFSQHA